MRLIFHEYFRPTKAELQALWGDSLIAFDASVLLNVYGYTKDTRQEISEIFLKYKNRLVIPYQYAMEYSVNRSSTISKQIGSCHTAIKDLRNINTQKFTAKTNHPHLSTEANNALNLILEELETSKKELERLIGSDPHAEMILEAFENGVGSRPNQEELEKLHAEAQRRIEGKIPPGYEDFKNKGTPRCWGDYIGWSQLMEISKEQNKSVIFVIDDAKEDWWKIEGSRKISPRPELIREFRELTGSQIWIYNSESFLRDASEFSDLKISARSIAEVKDTIAARQVHLVFDLDKDQNPELKDSELPQEEEPSLGDEPKFVSDNDFDPSIKDEGE